MRKAQLEYWRDLGVERGYCTPTSLPRDLPTVVDVLLHTNGGPIDGDDGEEYVMVRRSVFEELAAAHEVAGDPADLIKTAKAVVPVLENIRLVLVEMGRGWITAPNADESCAVLINGLKAAIHKAAGERA